jgi:hypothetical protein
LSGALPVEWRCIGRHSNVKAPLNLSGPGCPLAGAKAVIREEDLINNVDVPPERPEPPLS